MIARTSALAILAFSLAAADSARTTVSFDPGWRFFQGDAPGAKTSIEVEVH
jgi:hypothetical protein